MQTTLGRPNSGEASAGSTSEDVEARAGNLARLDGFGEIGFHHKTTAGAVDDADAVLHFGKCRLVDDVAGFVGQRHMQRDEIGALEQLVEFDLFHAHLQRAFLGQEGVITQHMHLQPDGALADDAADIAATDHAERLAGDLGAHEFRLLPLAGLGRGIGGGKLAGDGEHHGDRVLGSGDRVAEGRVHDDDTATRSGRDIDIVDADTGATDDLEVGRGGNQLFRRLGGGTDRETVIVCR